MKPRRKGKRYLVPRAYYEALFEVAKAINSSLRVDDVLQAVVRGTAKAMDVKACCVLLLSPDRTKLWHGASYGLGQDYVRKGELLADTSISEACNERRPVVVKRADLDWRVQYRDEAREEGIGSILSVPLMLKDEVIGALRVYTADPRDFPDEEVEFVQAVADLSAIALENARLRECVVKDYKKIRADLAGWYVAREFETVLRDASGRLE